jgi:broad specificity phosphatase PhoE
MALVVLSVVEQRLDAVRAVLAGESVVEVAVRYRVARLRFRASHKADDRAECTHGATVESFGVLMSPTPAPLYPDGTSDVPQLYGGS